MNILNVLELEQPHHSGICLDVVNFTKFSDSLSYVDHLISNRMNNKLKKIEKQQIKKYLKNK